MAGFRDGWGEYLAHGTTGIVSRAALDSLHERGYAIIDGALGATHAREVAAGAAAMSAAGALSPAKVSTGTSQRLEPNKRNDSIAWLKLPKGDIPRGDDAAALPPAVVRHLTKMERTRAELEGALRCGLARCSFMLAEYPGGGGR